MTDAPTTPPRFGPLIAISTTQPISVIYVRSDWITAIEPRGKGALVFLKGWPAPLITDEGIESIAERAGFARNA